MSPARTRRDYRVGRIGADKSLYSCLCQRDITLFWTMYEALLAAMLTLSRRERWEAYDQRHVNIKCKKNYSSNPELHMIREDILLVAHSK